MPRLTMNYLSLKGQPASLNRFEAARKTGDVAKGEWVQISGIRTDGKVSVDKATGPSEHWHSLDAFYGNVEGHTGREANDNAPNQ